MDTNKVITIVVLICIVLIVYFIATSVYTLYNLKKKVRQNIPEVNTKNNSSELSRFNEKLQLIDSKYDERCKLLNQKIEDQQNEIDFLRETIRKKNMIFDLPGQPYLETLKGMLIFEEPFAEEEKEPSDLYGSSKGGENLTKIRNYN